LSEVSTIVPVVPWAGLAGIGSMDGNPGDIPDMVGAILLIFRGRIRIFPAHWRSRIAAPPEPLGPDLSCNRKYVAKNEVTPRMTPVQTLIPDNMAVVALPT